MTDSDQSPPATPGQRADHPARDPMFDIRRYYCPVCREWFLSTLTHDCPHCGSEDLRLINTANVFPPIPHRQYDWCAWFDSDGEEAGRYGYGATEAKALDDLITEYGG